MNPSERHLHETADSLLNSMLTSLKAANLTCYFFNPKLGLFWLAKRDGKFRHPHVLGGPLTSAQQWNRLYLPDAKYKSGYGVKYEPTVPENLKRGVHDGSSFQAREKITSIIQIALWEGSATRPPNGSVNSCQVIIFLNYRKRPQPEESKRFVDAAGTFASSLRACLLPLAQAPVLTEERSGRLRCVNFLLRKELQESLLFVAKDQEDKKWRELLRTIVEQGYALMQLDQALEDPDSGRKAFCNIALLEENNKFSISEVHPPSPRKLMNRALKNSESHGVMEQAARYWQVIWIKNIRKYNLVRKKQHAKKRPSAHPDYMPQCLAVEGCTTDCELACPLIVQNHAINVINVEKPLRNLTKNSKNRDQFTTEDVLLLWQYASSVALVIRLFSLFKEVRALFDHQRMAVSAKTVAEIYQTTIIVAKSFGFDAQIWDWDQPNRSHDRRGTWYHSPNSNARQAVRVDGNTSEVRKSARILMLCDVFPSGDWTDRNTGQPTEVKLFRTDADGLYLGDESNQGSVDAENSEELCSRVKARKVPLAARTKATDIAFPLVVRGSVRAVMWCLCERYSKHITEDELLALSVLARSAGQAVETLTEDLRRQDAVLLGMLGYHFGIERAKQIRDAMRDAPKALNPLRIREAKNIIVVNMDIRNSTMATARDQSKAIVQLITDYHKSAREETQRQDGVFDKTIGDGVHLLFNVYGKGRLELPGYNDTGLGSSLKGALLCLEGTFRKFDELCANYMRGGLGLSRGFGLGAGVVIGDGHLGSFSADVGVPGMEYSILGRAANAAGKVQGWAKRGSNDSPSVLQWVENVIKALEGNNLSWGFRWCSNKSGSPQFFDDPIENRAEAINFLTGLKGVLLESQLNVHIAVILLRGADLDFVHESIVPKDFYVFTYPIPAELPGWEEGSVPLLVCVYSARKVGEERGN